MFIKKINFGTGWGKVRVYLFYLSMYEPSNPRY